jgi:hypothetical protein
MNKILIILCLSLLMGCGEDYSPTIPPRKGLECKKNIFAECLKTYGYFKCDKSGRSKFIIECVKAANGANLVKQCEKTSFDLFCESVLIETK